MNTSGVLPTPTGSEVNRLSREDGDEINNGIMNELLSSRGIKYIKRVMQNNIDAGCTFGVTSTFRVTPYRAHDTRDWRMPNTSIHLPDIYETWNRQLIEISRQTYGNMTLLGNICPITDTSPSADDAEYAKVGNGSQEARIEFARILHDAQIRVISKAGVDGILAEACRHPDDALGIARSVREAAIPLLIVSFEADENGVPDPIHKRDGYSFSDMRSDLQREAGDNVEVLVGANCVNGSLISRLINSGQQLDIAYPNESDTSRFGSAAVKKLRTIVNESSDTDIRGLLRSLLDEESQTPLDEYRALIRQCLSNNVSIVGNCCGGRPEHVRAAREVYDEVHQVVV